MSNKGIVTLAVGISLACAAGAIGLVALVKVAADRRAERVAAERGREENRAAALAAEREAGRAEAAEVFAAPARPAPAEEAEFAAAFAELGRALDRGDAAAVSRAFDGDRMFRELEQIGAFDRLPGNAGGGFRAGVRQGIDEKLGATLVANEMARWARTEVRHVRWSADRREAIVIAVHRHGDADEIPLRFRWWLVRRPGGWGVYDFEDLQMGLRSTRLVAALATPEMVARVGRNPLAFQAALAGVRDAILLVAKGDFEGGDRALAPARGGPWPPPLQALVELVEGMILIGREDPGGALARFDAAERLLPGMPCNALARGGAFVALGRTDEALAAVRAYQKEVGPDALSCTLEGTALEEQGKTAEAADAYRRALDEVADWADAFNGLRRVLPDGQKKELGARLARAADPQKVYDEVVRPAREDGDAAALDALLDGLREARPDAPGGLADDVRRQVKAEQFAAAADLMKAGLNAATAADREQVLDAYLFAMRGANRPLEGYAAVPAAHARHAFRTLADDLEDDVADGDEKATIRKHLTDLIGAHRKRVPADPWLWFFEGALHQHAKEYESAAKAFAAGAAKLPPGKADDGDPDAKDRDANLFHARRVGCLFELGKGVDAYRDSARPAETFRQLAGLYDAAKKYEGLRELIAAHGDRGRRDPERTFWQARLAYRTGEYDRAAPAYRKYLNQSDEKAISRWSARDELLRCVLRTKPADAEKAARELGAENVSDALKAAVAAAAGDRDELERLLAESVKGGGKTWFYSDEDFRRLINQDRYRDLRLRYPNPNPPAAEG